MVCYMKKIISALVLVSMAASSLMAWDVNADKNERDKILKGWQYPGNWKDIPKDQGPGPGPSPAQPAQASSGDGPTPAQPTPTCPSGGCPALAQSMQASPGGGPQSASVSSPVEAEDVIVMFTKEACPYCQYMKPIMEEVEKKFGKKFGHAIRFIYADIDVYPHYPNDYGFSTVPHIAYFKKGKQVDSHGSNDKTVTAEQVEERIRNLGLGKE